MDLRDYRGVIREAVRRERHCDQNWSWKVRAISKEKAQIGWGYLDFLEDPTSFVVKIYENDDVGMYVLGTVPNGHKIAMFVGNNRWDDVKTVEEGIAGVIHNMALYAHATY